MADSGRLDELQHKFDENPRRYFAPLANEFRKLGDTERSIELCRTYLPHLPGHMSGYIVYGQALFDAGRREESVHVFNQALRIDPENVIALRHLGDIARLQGSRTDAMHWYEKLLEVDPKNYEVSAYVDELAVAEVPEDEPAPQFREPEPEIVSTPSFTPAETVEHGDTPGTVFSSTESEFSSPAEPSEFVSASGPAVQRPDESVRSFDQGDEGDTSGITRSFMPYLLDSGEPSESSGISSESRDDAVAGPVSGADDAFAWDAADLDEDPQLAKTPVPFVTETLANLYIEQGLFSEALTVYRQLAETRDDPATHARVRELEAKVLEAQKRETQEVATQVSRVEPQNQGVPRQRPTMTIRDFFATIGTRRAFPESAPRGLAQLFPADHVSEADTRAARALADAYSMTSGAPTPQGSYIRPA